MADTLTPFLGLVKPVVGDEAGEDLWGEKWNANADKIDTFASLQGALTEAPTDGLIYGRQNSNWTPSVEKTDFDALTTTVDGHTNDIAILEASKADDAPATGLLYVRGGNAGDPSSVTWWNLATNGSVAWSNILNKPATFPSDWNTTANKPATFPPSAHQHAQSDIINLASDQTAQNTQISANMDAITALQTSKIGEAPNDGQQYVRQSLNWSPVAVPPAVGLVSVSDTPPGSPLDRQLWWESDSGGLFLRYNDGNSTAWVQVNAKGLADAPSDGYSYVRSSGVWQSSATFSGTLAANRAAAGYVVTGINTSSAEGAGGVLGQVGGGPTYGICGYVTSGVAYSFFGNGPLYAAGNITSTQAITAAGAMNVGGSINFTNISNFALGYSSAAGGTTGTGGYYWFFSGGNGYQMITNYFIRAVDNAAALGTTSYRWTYVAAVTGTINTSDEREKQDIRPLEEVELAVARRLKPLIVAYRWKDAVEKKGGDARIHFGVISQRVAEAFAAEGLDAARYAMWCEDQLEEYVDPVVEKDANGNDVTKAEGYMRKTGEVRYGIRYEQLIMFILAGM